jgi:hypothetical protein
MNKTAKIIISLAFVITTLVGAWLIGAAFDGSLSAHGKEAAVDGAELSWMVATECGKGDAACDAALIEANRNPYGVRFMEDGTAYPVGQN